MGRREELARGARETTRGALGLFRDNRRVVVLLAAALIFVWLLGEVASGEIMRLDTLAYQVFVETLRSDALTPFMEAFTSLASVVVLAVMAAVIAALVCSLYDGLTPDEVLGFDPSFLEELGISAHLTPNRRNGLSQLCKKIAAFAESKKS